MCINIYIYHEFSKEIVSNSFFKWVIIEKNVLIVFIKKNTEYKKILINYIYNFWLKQQ